MSNYSENAPRALPDRPNLAVHTWDAVSINQRIEN
jgi:hypothetical protein